MTAKESTIVIRMEAKQRDRLEALASEMNLSISELVRALLSHSLKCRTVKKFLMGD